MFSIHFTMENPRRIRFLAWYAETYGDGDDARKRFMEKTGLSKGRVSQFFDPNQAFGEIAAKNLALRLGKPEGFFLPGVIDAAGSADGSSSAQGVLSTIASGPGSAADSVTPTIADTLEQLGSALAAASQNTRDAVAGLLAKYAQNPAEGARIAKAIEMLLTAPGAVEATPALPTATHDAPATPHLTEDEVREADRMTEAAHEAKRIATRRAKSRT